jgi:hypothetical protein
VFPIIKDIAVGELFHIAKPIIEICEASRRRKRLRGILPAGECRKACAALPLSGHMHNAEETQQVALATIGGSMIGFSQGRGHKILFDLNLMWAYQKHVKPGSFEWVNF